MQISKNIFALRFNYYLLNKIKKLIPHKTILAFFIKNIYSTYNEYI